MVRSFVHKNQLFFQLVVTYAIFVSTLSQLVVTFAILIKLI